MHLGDEEFHLMNMMSISVLVIALGGSARDPVSSAAPVPLKLSWSNDMLRIEGPELAGGAVDVWYMEAYCRAGSSDRDWSETVIPHRTKLIEATPDGSRIQLRCELDDGLVVEHEIRAGVDEVTFEVEASNPTGRRSEAHWAQPCIRVDRFVGVPSEKSSEAYLPRCFVFMEEKPAWLPTRPWATKARYEPGQVWCPAHVDRNDVNPRPLSSLVPSNGLIGCVSADGKQVLATAWEPYQELFQGIIVCLHSDFRLGGVGPGEKRRVRGKLYLTGNDMDALVRRYERDFPEHARPER